MNQREYRASKNSTIKTVPIKKQPITLLKKTRYLHESTKKSSANRRGGIEAVDTAR